MINSNEYSVNKKEKEEKKEKEKKDLAIAMSLSNPRDDNYYLLDSYIMEKWFKMIRKMESYFKIKKKKKKLKRRNRQGIPDCLRGYVWQCFAGVENYRNKKNYYKMIEERTNIVYDDLDKSEKDIFKDLDRTFPNNTFFKEKMGLGQTSLFNVLSTFSKESETGYVQGMGFFTACLLNYMDEESAYWMLYLLMENYKMKGFFQKNFPELNRAHYKLLCLLRKFFPKIYESFKSKNVDPYIYASQWFLTLFFVNLKYEIFLRIFDVFLLEGPYKIIFRFGLALLKLNEEKIVNARQFDELMEVLKHLDEKITIDKLFEEAFNVKFTKKLLDEYERQYDMLRMSNGSDEITEQLSIITTELN